MRFLARLCLLLTLLWGTAAQALITRVSGQHKSATATSTTSVSISLPSAPTAGHLVVIGVECGASGVCGNLPGLSVSDGTNTYTATTHTPGSDGTFSTIGIWYLQNVPSGAGATVTVSWTGGSNQTVDTWIQEYAGAATSTVLEQEQAHLAYDEGGGSSAISQPSYTPTNANDLIFTVSQISQGCASVPAPYSVVDAIADSQCATDNIQTTAAATGTYATGAMNTNWIGMVAAFKVASGAACPPPSLALLGVGC